MIIKKNTKMVLFRFGNFWTDDFINEHLLIIKAKDYVWLQKTGKRASAEKIKTVIDEGGYIIFKEPKNAGNNYYLGVFTEMRMDSPKDEAHCPPYYKNVRSYSEQWFKVVSIKPISHNYIDSLILTQTGKKLTNIVDRTSSSFMFVQNSQEWDI